MRFGKKVSDSNSEEEEKEGRKIVFSAFILLEKFEFEFAKTDFKKGFFLAEVSKPYIEMTKMVGEE